ncbi:MAG: hypothetical protein PUH12_00355, partial [Lachnospiraceae bacterium]|nr:hypothetical protein [Lachnospiraceae bacterium]
MIPGFGKKKISREDELLRLETAMDDHLEKKYGTIVFRQKAFEGSNFLHHKDDRWYLEADLSYYWQKDLGKGKAEFRVERRDTEEGEVFKDNFYGKIIRKEFEQWVEKQAKSYFSE